MKYLVIEIQTLADGTVANLVTAHNTLADAETKYHQVLAAAVKSNTKYHSSIIITEKGEWLKGETYDHSNQS